MKEPWTRGTRIAVAVAATVLAVACSAGQDLTTGAPSTPTSGAAVETASTPPPTSAPATDPPVVAPPPTEPGPPRPDGPLRPGDRGPAVGRLQRRLMDLGFWVGPVDEQYGHLVRQAVYAFEKANRLPVDGTVSPADQEALAHASPVAPRSGPGSGRLIEVDKTRQLVILAVDGRAELVLNAASGTEQPYDHPTEGPQVADTPVGRHRILFALDELEDGKMGLLYRPRYFHPDAIALHGDDVVPPAPVSHGCVRISRQAMDLVWERDLAPVGSTVWVYGESPPPWPSA